MTTDRTDAPPETLDPDPPPVGLRCRKCNCADLRVVHTRPAPGNRVRRERRCRCCGFTFWTTEA